ELVHEALPELDFDEVSLKSQILKQEFEKPLLISSMTAGHLGSLDINQRLAEAASARGWLMGVGSQRRELFDREALNEWKTVRQRAPNALLLGNLGLSQLIETTTDKVKELVEGLEATAMIIHLNPLQECLQPEGTPKFKGGLKAIERVARELTIPIIIKETGCGFSEPTLRRLKDVGIRAVDISGYGGTHWGRIEGQRSSQDGVLAQASQTFASWGVSTAQSMLNAVNVQPPYDIWASGGVRTGLDAARLIAMGAKCVGFAKPLLQAAILGPEQLDAKMELIEKELKIALFCTGSKNTDFLRAKKVWKWRQN
ncbi:MAG: type 2 isopentenyl-diphosphate Delta-isomerase, partial [Bdellovibrionota bacterium]